MLLDLEELDDQFDMNIRGVIHCGARLGEELEVYRRLRVSPVYWIEANPAVIPRLRSNVEPYGQYVIQALLYSEDDVELDFNITNYDGMSSSILQFGTHPSFSPDTIFERRIALISRTLDSLAAEYEIEGCNFLNMDLQGAELHCLKGATGLLPEIDYVYSEVNTDEVYIGCARLGELDAFLEDFERVATRMCGTQGWGDALWIRREE